MENCGCAEEHSTNALRETSDGMELHLQELARLQNEINELGQVEIKSLLDIITPHEEKIILEKQALFEKREESIGKIPKFWAVSLRNFLSSRGFDENEVTCFDFLSRMSVEHIQGADSYKTGLKLHFYFEENNPLFENTLVSKDILLGDFGFQQSTTTPITWKLEPTCEGVVQKTAHQERLCVFDWLEDNYDAFLGKLLQTLELWENPLQFYTPPGETPETEYEDNVKRALEELKLYQQQINDLNKSLDENIMNVMKQIGDKNESTNKILYDKRKETIQKIPNFWATVLRNNFQFVSILSKEDIELLKYITNVDIVHKLDVTKAQSSMTVDVYLSELNPYVGNMVLSKTFFIGHDGKRTCKITTVVWKQGAKDPTEDENKPSESQETKSLKLINWFCEDIETDYNSLVLLRILELWQDPLQYVLDVENTAEFEAIRMKIDDVKIDLLE